MFWIVRAHIFRVFTSAIVTSSLFSYPFKLFDAHWRRNGSLYCSYSHTHTHTHTHLHFNALFGCGRQHSDALALIIVSKSSIVLSFLTVQQSARYCLLHLFFSTHIFIFFRSIENFSWPIWLKSWLKSMPTASCFEHLSKKNCSWWFLASGTSFDIALFCTKKKKRKRKKFYDALVVYWLYFLYSLFHNILKCCNIHNELHIFTVTFARTLILFGTNHSWRTIMFQRRWNTHIFTFVNIEVLIFQQKTFLHFFL